MKPAAKEPAADDDLQGDRSGEGDRSDEGGQGDEGGGDSRSAATAAPKGVTGSKGGRQASEEAGAARRGWAWRRGRRRWRSRTTRPARTMHVAPDQAAAAGLEVEDVIVAVDGDAVASSDDLRRRSRRTRPGDRVMLKVLRGEGELDVEVTLGASQP
ncbi:MAG: PDZ domain-containing protein [Anaerolineae bacterium]